MPDEALKEKEEGANSGRWRPCVHRLKTNFILHRIAEEEKIQVTRADVDEHIRHQAMHHNVTPEKLRQEIDKNEGMSGLLEQILLAKTIDFLGSNATIESAPATTVSSPLTNQNDNRSRLKFLSIGSRSDGGRTDGPRGTQL